MSKVAEVTVLAAFCILCSAGLGFAHARHASHVRGLSIRKARMFAAPANLPSCPPIYCAPARASRPGIPDFTVQYGYVANPGMASGSIGAMLQGRNPAAGAVP